MTPGRSCGSCTLCCMVPAIPELNKPMGQWCPHCDRSGGAAGKGGCTIYESRPGACRRFQCLWLMGLGPEDLKPEHSHLVLQPLLSMDRIDVYCDPDHPEAYRRKDIYDGLMGLSKRYTIVVVFDGYGIILKDGTERRVNVTF